MFGATVFCVCILAISSTNAVDENGKIVEIQTKTSGEIFADISSEAAAHLDLVICGTTDCCLIDTLSNGNINFMLGAIDDFFGPDLQGCENFEMPNNELKLLKISHRGYDAWLGEFINVSLDSGVYFHCEITQWLDNDEEVELACR